jgi:predicted nucleic acid-binding protein
MERRRRISFDASALIFAKSILHYIKQDYEILVTPLIKNESGSSDDITVVQLEDEDKEFVYKVLRFAFTKDYAINYKKGRKVKNAGEAEALAIAKREDIPVVIHEKRISKWAKTWNVESIRLVDLPDRVEGIPVENLLEFYKRLCKQRSSEKACEKLDELLKK